MATIDGRTGVITQEDANTLAERVAVATARVSVARSGLSATRDAAVYQAAAEARQDYTYGYTGEYQLSAKAYYVDSSGALHDEPVPAEGGTAVLVPTYVIGLIRYLDGVEVDRPNLETGAVLDYMDYRTFDSEDDGWYWEDPYDGVLSYLAGWTHVATTNGGTFASGESMMQVDFGQAPVPVNQGDGAFDAYRVTPIRLRIPAGTMNGLEDRTFEMTDTVAIRQYFRNYGAVTSIQWRMDSLTYKLDGVEPGGSLGMASRADSDRLALVLEMSLVVRTTFESGHTEDTSWWEALGVSRLEFSDYGQFDVTPQAVEVDATFKASNVLRLDMGEWTAAQLNAMEWPLQTQLGVDVRVEDLSAFGTCAKSVVARDATQDVTSQSRQGDYSMYPYGGSTSWTK